MANIKEIREIHGAPHELRLAAFKNFNLLDQVDALDAVADKAWSEIFDSIMDSKNSIAYWDGYTVERPGYHSFMRYALHRSTKQDGYLQLSVMEIRNGDIIPTSDTQHCDLKSFLSEVPRNAVVMVI